MLPFGGKFPGVADKDGGAGALAVARESIASVNPYGMFPGLAHMPFGQGAVEGSAAAAASAFAASFGAGLGGEDNKIAIPQPGGINLQTLAGFPTRTNPGELAESCPAAAQACFSPRLSVFWVRPSRARPSAIAPEETMSTCAPPSRSLLTSFATPESHSRRSAPLSSTSKAEPILITTRFAPLSRASISAALCIKASSLSALWGEAPPAPPDDPAAIPPATPKRPSPLRWIALIGVLLLVSGKVTHDPTVSYIVLDRAPTGPIVYYDMPYVAGGGGGEGAAVGTGDGRALVPAPPPGTGSPRCWTTPIPTSRSTPRSDWRVTATNEPSRSWQECSPPTTR